MNEQTPGNPFQSDIFEYAPTSINSPLRGEPLFRLGDRYLVYQVRRGGMGEVFLCRPTGMEPAPLFALKSFQKRFFFDPAIRGAFIREIRHWSQLSGLPNIMPVLGLEHFDNRPFVLMTGIEPGSSGVITVRDVLKQHHGPLPMHLTFAYAYQIAVGMYTAQQRVSNLIHGDLKPENLLLIFEMGLYISDFGLAQVVTESTQGEHPLESTWAYRAPESWRLSGIPSQATDIYAFGVMLYELLTGEHPFHAKTRDEWSQAHHTLQPSPPLEFPQDGAAADCMKLALHCLAKESADRPQGFEPILRELEQLGSHYFSGMLKDLKMHQTLFSVAYTEFKGFAISTLLASEQYEEALTELEQIPKEAFDKPLWHMLGNTLSLLERDSEALSAFEQALQTAPEDPELLSDYALSLKRLKRFQEAIPIYEELITRIADEKLYMRIATNLATVYLESDHPEKAASLLLGLARSYPQASEVWANLGKAYRMLERYSDAMNCYQKALASAPNNTTIQMLLVAVLMDNLGRVNEALLVLELVGAQKEKYTYEWVVRFLACNLILENEEYLATYYHDLVEVGWAQAKVAKLQDDVRQLVEMVRNVQSILGTTVLSSPKDETVATSTTKNMESSEQSRFTHTALQGDHELDRVDSRILQEAPSNNKTQSSPTTLSDGRYGKDMISLPFLNIRFYMVDFGREYSIDFYDDVNSAEYVDRFLTEWRRATRNDVPMVGSDFTLRPTLFYFTVCPNCEIAILTNRDQGKQLRCRRCDTFHNATENKRYDLTALLTRIQSELGRSPVSMKGLLQVLLIQPIEHRDLSIVEAICTEAGFTQIPEDAHAAVYLWNLGSERGMVSIDRPFSVWQKLAEGGERAGDDGTSPEVEVVLHKLRSATMIRSLSTVLDPRDTSIHSLLLQGKLDQAEVVLQEQMLAGEDITDSLASLAKILISHGRYSEAQEKIMALLQFRPDKEEGWSLSGELEMKREHYQDAIASLERARSIDPVNWHTLADLAFCYHKLGDVGKARSYAVLARSLGAVSPEL